MVIMTKCSPCLRKNLYCRSQADHSGVGCGVGSGIRSELWAPRSPDAVTGWEVFLFSRATRSVVRNSVRHTARASGCSLRVPAQRRSLPSMLSSIYKGVSAYFRPASSPVSILSVRHITAHPSSSRPSPHQLQIMGAKDFVEACSDLVSLQATQLTQRCSVYYCGQPSCHLLQVVVPVLQEG